MPDVSVIIVVAYKIDEFNEIRFVYTEIGWKPDIIVDYLANEVSKPPSCFKPTDEVIEALNEALKMQLAGALVPVGLYQPEMN